MFVTFIIIRSISKNSYSNCSILMAIYRDTRTSAYILDLASKNFLFDPIWPIDIWGNLNFFKIKLALPNTFGPVDFYLGHPLCLNHQIRLNLLIPRRNMVSSAWLDIQIFSASDRFPEKDFTGITRSTKKATSYRFFFKAHRTSHFSPAIF